MRINKFIAQASGLSRRAADEAIIAGKVTINNQIAALGDGVAAHDTVTLDSQPLSTAVKTLTIILNKPVGYVCSRAGQGSATIYDLLPAEYQHLNIAGRLDKDSSGLLLLTSDGELANRLTHPRYNKTKTYEIGLDRILTEADQTKIDKGIALEDGLSALKLQQLDNRQHWQIKMHEGRNRQIRRTFAALGYHVVKLHRTHFGDCSLENLPSGKHQVSKVAEIGR
jgi:23S rRNA pseudouridine2605 synthase